MTSTKVSQSGELAPSLANTSFTVSTIGIQNAEVPDSIANDAGLISLRDDSQNIISLPNITGDNQITTETWPVAKFQAELTKPYDSTVFDHQLAVLDNESPKLIPFSKLALSESAVAAKEDLDNSFASFFEANETLQISPTDTNAELLAAASTFGELATSLENGVGDLQGATELVATSLSNIAELRFDWKSEGKNLSEKIAICRTQIAELLEVIEQVTESNESLVTHLSTKMGIPNGIEQTTVTADVVEKAKSYCDKLKILLADFDSRMEARITEIDSFEAAHTDHVQKVSSVQKLRGNAISEHQNVVDSWNIGASTTDAGNNITANFDNYNTAYNPNEIFGTSMIMPSLDVKLPTGEK